MNTGSWLALACAACCSASVLAAQDRTFRYGGANVDCRDSKRLNNGLARASMTEALIFTDAAYVDNKATSIHLTTADLCKDNSIAPPARFRVPPPTCSATMISSRRLVTAAHCLLDSSDAPMNVGELRVLTNYSRAFATDPAQLDPKNVRAVSKILYCRRDPQTDLAVIEVDRPFDTGFARARAPTLGEGAHLISFPLGFPLAVETCINEPATCVQPNVTVLEQGWFRSPLDSFWGSSGGGVFGQDGKLIGVFRGGAAQLQGNGNCLAEQVFPDACHGDIASRVDGLSADLFDDSKKLPAASCFVGGDPDWDPKCPASEIHKLEFDKAAGGPVTGEVDCSNVPIQFDKF